MGHLTELGLIKIKSQQDVKLTKKVIHNSFDIQKSFQFLSHNENFYFVLDLNLIKFLKNDEYSN